MKEIQHPKGKIYYSMGEVCEMFDVNPSLIRFWESKFDALNPQKNKKGNRLFTPGDVDQLKLIYHLVKEKGMTLAGAQKRIRQHKDAPQQDMELLDRLQKIRAMLVGIREELRDDPEGYVSIPVGREAGDAVPEEAVFAAEPEVVWEPVPPAEGETAMTGAVAFVPEPAPEEAAPEPSAAPKPAEERPRIVEQTLF